ncbi:MAG: beta-lactamase family protein [Flavisolibacter sp.]|nr:beta-lactamase family protein [Flavisolibacter sp.]
MFFSVSAQDSLERKIDQYVMQQMQKTYTPGVAIGIVKDGKTLLKKGYGLSNVELAVFTDTNSVFQLLSISKQFIATAIMQLVENKKLSLDQPISQYISEAPAEWKTITIRNLLNHTSGIIDLTDVPPFFEQIREDASPAQLLEQVYKQALLFPAGTQWRYSNSNYFLLGLIIEKVSGKQLDDYLKGNIFQPLGMKATRMNSAVDVIPYRVSGYHWIDEEAEKVPAFITGFHGIKNVLQNAIYISPTRMWAAGGIVSSLSDLIKWDSAQVNHLLLSKQSIDEMVMPGKLISGTPTNYGLGNELFSIRGHRVAGHQGGGMAFNTTYLRFLDDHLSIIVLCNQTTGPSKQMALHIASMLNPDLDVLKKANKIIKESLAVRNLFKSVLQNAREGKIDFQQFAPEAQQTAQLISRVGPEFLQKQGILKSVELIDEQNMGGKHTYIYKTVFDNSTITWNFSLNEKRQVLDLRPQTNQ